MLYSVLELTPLVGPTLKNVVSSRVSKICQPIVVFVGFHTAALHFVFISQELNMLVV